MYSVPFSIDEYEGFLQTRGIVRIEEEAVVLEFKKTGGIAEAELRQVDNQ